MTSKNLLKNRLKKEILEELKSAGSKSEQVFKHPLVLLLCGFFLTTIIGGIFTYYYQSKESKRQREYLIQQKYSDYKLSSIDEVLSAFGEAKVACHNSLKIFIFYPLPKDEDKIILDEWRKTSNKWRSNIDKYKYKLNAHFDNPEIKKTFDEIVDERNFIANDITNFFVDYVDNPKQAANNEKLKERVQQTLKKLSALDSKVAKLESLMVEETRINNDSLSDASTYNKPASNSNQ